MANVAVVQATDFNQLIGRWQRTDGGYVIEIRNVESNGNMQAGYFNPNPIHVGRAEASTYDDRIKVEIELQDRGYPGSTYTLVYDPDKDVLFGYYFQAIAKQYFEVIFTRIP
jgi:hypothetical protein